MRKNIFDELKSGVKGKVKVKEVLAGHTSFRIGGPADIWAEPRDTRDLKKILAIAKKHELPVFVIGGGSNLLVSDKGFHGITIHLGSPFFKKAAIKGAFVKAGAGYNVTALVRLCCSNSLGGIESLIGIPGTVGGAVFMNAGGWAKPIFKNLGDFVASLKVIDYGGNIKILKRKGLNFGYRSSNLDGYIILEAMLKLKKDKSSGNLNSQCSKFLSMKRQKQALDMPSAGCVFKNPKGFQFTCGQMIDMLGLKGLKMGGAQVSEKHANFIINRNGATCGDVLRLIKAIRGKVMENYKIPLELEIKVI